MILHLINYIASHFYQMEVFRKVDNSSSIRRILNQNHIPCGRIMQISIAHFQPFQSCPKHQHFDLFEVFIVKSGSISVVVNQTQIDLGTGDVLLINPKNDHELHNRTDILCEMLVLGIASTC